MPTRIRWQRFAMLVQAVNALGDAMPDARELRRDERQSDRQYESEDADPSLLAWAGRRQHAEVVSTPDVGVDSRHQ